jgi:hypothetical protein
MPGKNRDAFAHCQGHGRIASLDGNVFIGGTHWKRNAMILEFS